MLPVRLAMAAGVAAAVLLAPVQRADAAGSRVLDCLIDASARVKVSAATSGVLQTVGVDRGDAVRAGQVVAELESGVERANVDLARQRAENRTALDTARAQAEFARRKRDRLERLAAANAGAVTEAARDEAATEARVAALAVEEAQTAIELARLELARAESLLAQRRVVSPVNGVVVERNLAPGEYRNEQTHILTLAQVDPLHVELFAPAELFGRLAVGAEARIAVEGAEARRRTARIAVIDRIVDAASGTFGVRLVMPNPQADIPAGLRCKAELQLAR